MRSAKVLQNMLIIVSVLLVFVLDIGLEIKQNGIAFYRFVLHRMWNAHINVQIILNPSRLFLPTYSTSNLNQNKFLKFLNDDYTLRMEAFHKPLWRCHISSSMQIFMRLGSSCEMAHTWSISTLVIWLNHPHFCHFSHHNGSNRY